MSEQHLPLMLMRPLLRPHVSQVKLHSDCFNLHKQGRYTLVRLL